MPDSYCNDQLEHYIDRAGMADRLARIVADHTGDAFVVTGAEPVDAPNGPRIVYVNPAFERMTGWRLEEVVGKTPRILQTPETDRAELDRVRAALKRWQPVRAELLNRHRDGRLVWIEMDIAPVPDENGWYRYWVAVQRDVTERRRAHDALNDARYQAELASDAKSRFLANCSHELRTPMNAVIGFAEMLASELPGQLNDKQKEYLEDISASGRHVLQLLGDMLDMARIEAGRIEVEPEPGHPASVVARACAMLRGGALERGMELREQLAPCSRAVMFDETRLMQCLVNIIGNAVKYSHHGACITVKSEDCEDHFCITVTDNGPGMDAAEIETAMVPFGRVGNALTHDGGGLGLGLPITGYLMQAMGGAMHLESRPGTGTTVRLCLPRADAGEDAAGTVQADCETA